MSREEIFSLSSKRLGSCLAFIESLDWSCLVISNKISKRKRSEGVFDSEIFASLCYNWSLVELLLLIKLVALSSICF